MEKQTDVVVIVYNIDYTTITFTHVCSLTKDAIYYTNDNGIVFKHNIDQEKIKQLIVL